MRVCVKTSPLKLYFTSFHQSCVARNKAKTSCILDITACLQLPKTILSNPSNLSIMDFFFNVITKGIHISKYFATYNSEKVN